MSDSGGDLAGDRARSLAACFAWYFQFFSLTIFSFPTRHGAQHWLRTGASPPSQQMRLQCCCGHPPWDTLPVSHIDLSHDESSSKPHGRELFVLFLVPWLRKNFFSLVPLWGMNHPMGMPVPDTQPLGLTQ